MTLNDLEQRNDRRPALSLRVAELLVSFLVGNSQRCEMRGRRPLRITYGNTAAAAAATTATSAAATLAVDR